MNISNSPVVFSPRFLPRGIVDFAITTLIAFPIQATGLFVVPAFVTGLLFSSIELALFTAVLVYVLFLLFSVWSVSLSNDGIRFKRMLGGPKFLAWSEVTSVTEVTRWELIRKGWIWPLFPAREMTACLSSVKHYRISWHEGFCYFPPSDTHAFEHHANVHLSSR